jgi:hypothetical protein
LIDDTTLLSPVSTVVALDAGAQTGK